MVRAKGKLLEKQNKNALIMGNNNALPVFVEMIMPSIETSTCLMTINKVV